VVSVYPVVVRGRLDEPLSGWLWLVKWLLLIPHFVVLAFLWLAFFVVSVVAFFAILFTGRYPGGLFEFNVGVLRWTWRVGYYGYGALGTDRYPPFTLAEDPTYPAGLEVQYPDRLSRGLVLVKWWLLAIPQVLIVGAFSTGGYVAHGAVEHLRAHRRDSGAVHPPLPGWAVRLRHRNEPVGAAGHGLCGVDDRRLPAVPPRPRPKRTIARRRTGGLGLNVRCPTGHPA
jgi:hypothetical protein